MSMADELERQLEGISLVTVLGPDVRAELEAALRDYRDDLDELPPLSTGHSA